MSDFRLSVRHPFGDLMQTGHHGRPVAGPCQVCLRERRDLALRVISANAGQADAIAAAVLTLTGLQLPMGAAGVSGDGIALIGTAPGQWLALSEGHVGFALLESLSGALAGLATIVDQSDGKAVLEISGPRARDTLAKGCALDLHPSVFIPGSAATTPVALIDCQIWQIDATPTYGLGVPTSYAESFWTWLTASAAEYGYEVLPVKDLEA